MSAFIEVENVVSETVKDYLTSAVDAAIIAACPAVTFYDPMSLDDAHRCIVQVPQFVSDSAAPGNFQADVLIGIKSQWAQPTIADDHTAHTERVKGFRGALWDEDIVTGLQTASNGRVSIYFVHPERACKTEIRDNWFYSETVLKIEGGITEPTE